MRPFLIFPLSILTNLSLTAPTSPTLKTAPLKPVFGVSLDVVAEYGFVTSMIAGQRHDLPGVCFSAVEEIYRRGQGASRLSALDRKSVV